MFGFYKVERQFWNKGNRFGKSWAFLLWGGTSYKCLLLNLFGTIIKKRASEYIEKQFKGKKARFWASRSWIVA